MEYRFETKNTCSKIIKFNLDGNIITDVEFLGGGCPGNLQALPRLVDKMTVEEIQNKLSGIICAHRNTSCADQLAKAVKEAYEKQNQLTSI